MSEYPNVINCPEVFSLNVQRISLEQQFRTAKEELETFQRAGKPTDHLVGKIQTIISEHKKIVDNMKEMMDFFNEE